ncbi:hypothetical protein ES754_05300 [Psychrobacter frigidicola]|uniref:Uncharacterized protein n=1 Tax=Psychrobacter frigidicola TaxID=45611 RepID=A0A5C7A4Z9_9GAMM|nr:hypothetical protein [Psychrobacter frigidicola]TXD98342.1 hypothetical protein ES754_05300 [Psychrobacter frigidicola]
MSSYKDVVIETYINTKGGSSKSIRARPIAGQSFDTSMNVECSSKMRKSYPVGTRFLIQAKISEREGGTPFLYAYYNAPYRIVAEREIEELIG